MKGQIPSLKFFRALPIFIFVTLITILLGSQSAQSYHTVRGVEERVISHAESLQTGVSWDDLDSHKWIGEVWSSDDINVNWRKLNGRTALQAAITNTGNNWAIMRTDGFHAENWEAYIGLRADIYQTGAPSAVDLKLEVRGPSFDPPDGLVESIYCNDLSPNEWHTCTWIFDTANNNYSEISFLSMVFDHLNNTSPTFYVDNLRLVTPTGEEEWDDMDDESRWWFYAGNWYLWNDKNPFGHGFAIEPISHNGRNPRTPAGSLYLQWDYLNGEYPEITNAEIGTSRLDDSHDWSDFSRLSADIMVSDSDVPISVFFWDADTKTGFGTPTRKVGVASSWESVTWDLPWPSWFDNTSIDEVKFIVNDINKHKTGALYIDNITLIPDTPHPPATGLSYIFEDFNDRNEFFNDFQGNWGVLNSEFINASFDTNTYAGTWGASLKVDYSLSDDQFAGIWQSLFGHSDYPQSKYIDFTDIYGNLNETAKDFEQIHFWVRGSGSTTATHNIKVELKDSTGDFNRTAYRYITIDDSDTTWRKVVLDADVTNASFWSYNLNPPDPQRMKQLVFVIESALNNSAGTFFIDDIVFVDEDDSPINIEELTDEQFLNLISKKTFLYFLDWYDPDTGLFQDRSTFPKLMSTASTGFGLTALTIGEHRGWISRTQAIQMITRTLQTLHDGQSETDTIADATASTNGYKGFYYHFLGKDALRVNQESELSPVDTALLLAGVLTVREHFIDVPEIVNLADKLYERVEWNWMVDTNNPSDNWFYLAWKPECGSNYNQQAPGGGCFSDYHWAFYTDEIFLVSLLALGSPTYPITEDVFYDWIRDKGTYQDLTHVRSWPGSLFTYVFAHLWIDFEPLGKDNHPDPEKQVDWWENSVTAAQTNKRFVQDHQDDTFCDGDENYTTYNEVVFGLTAADGPPGIRRLFWEGNTSELRALQGSGASSVVRNAAAGYAHTSLEIEINPADSLMHELSLYLLDWDQENRGESIIVMNPTDGSELATSEKIDNFQEGKYVRFAFQGNIKIQVRRDNLANTVLSGIFFDTVEHTSAANDGQPEAKFLGLDKETQGDWVNKYGGDGYVLLNWHGYGRDLQSLPDYIEKLKFNSGYHAYGAAPAAVPPDHDGTIAPYGAGMATPFLTDKAIVALKYYFLETDIWRYRFGFGDAYNLDPPYCQRPLPESVYLPLISKKDSSRYSEAHPPLKPFKASSNTSPANFPWYNHAAFGIDQGPMLISIENHRSGLIWQTMARNDNVSRALNIIFPQTVPQYSVADLDLFILSDQQEIAVPTP